MTFNDLLRKRELSPTKTLSLKIPRLDNLLYDGSFSRSSSPATSTSNTSLGAIYVRGRLKRGFSSIRSIFNSKNDESDTPDSSVVITRSGSRAGFTDATTVPHALKLQLTGSPDVLQSYANLNNTDNCTKDLIQDGPQLADSTSTAGVRRRLSQKLLCPFNHSPTIIVKPQLRSRPSVQTFYESASDFPDVDLTAKRSSKASTLTASLCSNGSKVALHDLNDKLAGRVGLHNPQPACSFISDGEFHRKLTPIAENVDSSYLTIKTVEATATAKTFFELHFNGLLQARVPRSTRLKTLRYTIHQMNLPQSVRSKIMQIWVRDESNVLRRNRVLRQEVRNHIKIADYEVIKVLGKGSFGVVRLVKERLQNDRDVNQGSTSNPSLSRKSSVTTLVKNLTCRKHPILIKKEVYAMKVIRKSDMIRNAQEGHLRAERDFLVAAEGSKWVIPLLAAFQDSKFLYLVMDFCIGGDFLSLLIRKNVLSEEITKWYIAEMILCIEEAHRMRWIHRDVKPDNFLIGADGHLKISDFGLAFNGGWQHDQKFYHNQRHSLLEKLNIQVDGDEKDRQDHEKVVDTLDDPSPTYRHRYEQQLDGELVLDWRNRTQRRKLARSVVGTSQYMAPEVIRGDMYDGRCDWWSVGIIMYECLYGFTPFACEDRHSTKLKILKHKSTLQFPDCGKHGPSHAALDLIQRLLVEKEDRLCTTQYQLNDYTRKTFSGYTRMYYADKTHRNYAGYFVYGDDAQDLKQHDFFKPIPWELMHTVTPPFVPRVKDWEDTKYFDDEGSVSDIQSVSSFGDELDMKENDTPTQKGSHQPEGQTIIPGTPKNERNEAEISVNAHNAKQKKQKERKRPRDKILRDVRHREVALTMRRQGAFLGYGYYKPKGTEEIINQVLQENVQTEV